MYSIMTSPTWLNLGERGIYRDLRRRIYSYLNPADRLLVEAAHCSSAGENAASKYWCCDGHIGNEAYASPGRCKWNRALGECAKYGYVAPVLWLIREFPRIHKVHADSSRLIYNAAIANQVEFIEDIFKPLDCKNAITYKYSHLLHDAIARGADFEVVVLLRNHGAGWDRRVYPTAVVACAKRGDFELAKYIERNYKECSCGAGLVVENGRKYCRGCGGSDWCALRSINYWEDIIGTANAAAAEYYWNHCGADKAIILYDCIVSRFSGEKDYTREQMIEMITWCESHGHRINNVNFSFLYMTAAGWVAEAEGVTTEIVRDPDFELVKWLHGRGCVFTYDHMCQVLLRSVELYQWGMKNGLAVALTENTILRAAKYGTPDLVRLLLSSWNGPITFKMLSTILKTECIELFDEVYARFKLSYYFFPTDSQKSQRLLFV
jgi:hypothetical protein